MVTLDYYFSLRALHALWGQNLQIASMELIASCQNLHPITTKPIPYCYAQDYVELTDKNADEFKSTLYYAKDMSKSIGIALPVVGAFLLILGLGLLYWHTRISRHETSKCQFMQKLMIHIHFVIKCKAQAREILRENEIHSSFYSDRGSSCQQGLKLRTTEQLLRQIIPNTQPLLDDLVKSFIKRKLIRQK
eukprot:TRINITY_DN6001_c0_g1_i1.p1 TRINITY_DN6001_c0_g1~~TRINITY_DN6001_c0_g1_i1.p1  ORF type:complete len:191 (+),score=25.97 TRINITY_DN6001_c0_g1_i1:1078-1650(+)